MAHGRESVFPSTNEKVGKVPTDHMQQRLRFEGLFTSISRVYLRFHVSASISHIARRATAGCRHAKYQITCMTLVFLQVHESFGSSQLLHRQTAFLDTDWALARPASSLARDARHVRTSSLFACSHLRPRGSLFGGCAHQLHTSDWLMPAHLDE